VLLKKLTIPQFRELFWKVKIYQSKEMMSIQSRIPIVKKAGHLLPVLPLIPYENSNVDEEKAGTLPLSSIIKLGNYLTLQSTRNS
jgi:hypothetical protein